ncbi:hypothetical protein RirG_022030 [Rhizophagus irregularis DAOM 197198w]|uniref:Uncharacterized protein n=1 Tax=Rhizophagus irregularis (strain DAOM 197198w) TaxID=1432141 RepID=A0A015IMK0_RHIIW|nr:hypothetical protein RirG_198020 [Rhizophagus irregularis DAOM 197198w]EXX63687.1 hypothetical protein RirG_150010 [Rhizophagus irregularis DAOM 197198w]EXX77636.1 hypothetical protein RirG_022030 [Rhizophagus irregularis DAOM 197198w]
MAIKKNEVSVQDLYRIVESIFKNLRVIATCNSKFIFKRLPTDTVIGEVLIDEV